jgi:hypothetical protein
LLLTPSRNFWIHPHISVGLHTLPDIFQEMLNKLKNVPGKSHSAVTNDMDIVCYTHFLHITIYFTEIVTIKCLADLLNICMKWAYFDKLYSSPSYYNLVTILNLNAE